MGSLVYLIFSLINGFSFAPVASTEYADDIVSVHEANGQDAAVDHTEAVKPLFDLAVLQVFGDYTARVSKSMLRLRERDVVLFLIGLVLLRIPFKVTSTYAVSLTHSHINSHTPMRGSC